MISETGSRVSKRWPQWCPGAFQVRLDQGGGHSGDVLGHQGAAQRRGRVHQQRWPGSPRGAA